MAGTIEIVKPNLFIARGVYPANGESKALEVYFSIGDGDEALKEATFQVDSMVSERIDQLKVGWTSELVSPAKGLAVPYRNAVLLQYGNFEMPLGQLNKGFTLAPGIMAKAFCPNKADIKAGKYGKPAFWDPNLDPREIYYARTCHPDVSATAQILRNFDRFIAELEDANSIAIDRKTTREALEKRLAELGRTPDRAEAVYHVISGELHSAAGAKDVPVGRVSVFPHDSHGEEKAGPVLQALAEKLSVFDGPPLSLDHSPRYMHQLKEIEPAVETLTRKHGYSVKVTSMQDNWRRLLFQE